MDKNQTRMRDQLASRLFSSGRGKVHLDHGRRLGHQTVSSPVDAVAIPTKITKRAGQPRGTAEELERERAQEICDRDRSDRQGPIESTRQRLRRRGAKRDAARRRGRRSRLCTQVRSNPREVAMLRTFRPLMRSTVAQRRGSARNTYRRLGRWARRAGQRREHLNTNVSRQRNQIAISISKLCFGRTLNTSRGRGRRREGRNRTNNVGTVFGRPLGTRSRSGNRTFSSKGGLNRRAFFNNCLAQVRRDPRQIRMQRRLGHKRRTSGQGWQGTTSARRDSQGRIRTRRWVKQGRR